jgi:hypothetical protein
MSFTNTRLFRTVWGNKLVEAWDVTADNNSGVVTTGLSVIDALGGVTVVSAATGSQNFKMNKNAAGTATNGSIMVSSCTNGDHFIVIAVGH